MDLSQICRSEILNQPGYSFLAASYNLLYQCIMPNCKLIIANLRKHCDLSDETEKHILESSHARIRCQRLLNFMLDVLNADRDYMKFCYLLFLSTVVTDLPCQMISMFQSNGHWDCTVRVHPELEALHAEYQATTRGACVHQYSGKRGNKFDSIYLEYSDHNPLESHATVATELEEALDGKAEKLINKSGILHARSRRKQVHHIQSEVERHGPVLHTAQLQLSDQMESTSNLSEQESVSNSVINVSDSVALSSSYALNTGNINTNANTSESITLQSDPTASGPFSEMNIHSELSTSPYPQSNDVSFHAEPVSNLNYDQSTITSSSVPENLSTNKDLDILKHKYTSLLQSFPLAHLATLECLQDHLTDDCICAVVEATSADSANKMMLDCMISRLTCKEDLLDLFDHLEEITDAHDVRSTVNALRQELQHNFEEDSTLQIRQPNPSSRNETETTKLELKSWFLTQTTLSDHCKDLFRRHYQALCSSLPRDVQRTKGRLLQYSRALPNSAIEKIVPDIAPEIVNQKIVNFLIISCKNDGDVIDFCDLFERLVENSLYICCLRNDFLTLDYTKPLDQAIAVTAGNLPLDEQTTMSIQPRNSDTQDELSVTENTTIQDSTEPIVYTQLTSKRHLKSRLDYKQSRLEQGLTYFQPPAKPSILIDRKELLDKLASAIVTSCLNPDDHSPTVAVTGAGGFGKTTLIRALCYHEAITEHFMDGFLFIEIGLQPIDPASQLHQLYSRLTGGKTFPRGSLVNLIEEVRTFTYRFYQSLLVLIDDVWDMEDAEPILQAFNSCKTIITSRKNDICQFISTREHVIVDAMTESEAVSLLTEQLIDIKSLSRDTIKLVSDLALDVHLWPLLLFLVRGHIKRNQNLYSHSFEKTIKEVQSGLYKNGLTAFDKNYFDKSKGRKVAIKACVEVSLDFLQAEEKDRLITLILYTGIGSSIPISVLHLLWQVSKEEAKVCIEKLWSYGLVTSKALLIPPHNNTQDCAEVHCTIGMYISNSLSSTEVVRLSRMCEALTDITDGLTNAFIESYGCHPSQLDQVTFLEYWKIRLEHDILTFYIRRINMCAVTDPHKIILFMQQIQEGLQQIPGMFQVLAELADEFATIGEESKMLLKKTTTSSQKLSQAVGKYMYENDYNRLISTLQSYCSNYEIGKIAKKSVELCGKVISKFGGQVHIFFVQQYQRLLMLTPEYHGVTGTTIVLARIELHFDLYKQIISALQSKSTTEIQAINEYIKSGRFHEEEDLVNIHHLIKLKRVAPDFVR